MTRKLSVRALAELAAVDAGYSRDDVLTVSRRRETVTVTLVERVCSGCGRRGLDVREPWRGEGAMCAAGVGCNTKARAIADLTVAGVTLEDIGRARVALSRMERAIRRRGVR